MDEHDKIWQLTGIDKPTFSIWCLIKAYLMMAAFDRDFLFIKKRMDTQLLKNSIFVDIVVVVAMCCWAAIPGRRRYSEWLIERKVGIHMVKNDNFYFSRGIFFSKKQKERYSRP